MENVITIIARIETKKDRAELVKSELVKLRMPTLQEVGCIKYDVHQSNQHPELFFLYGQWESREFFLHSHMESEHLAVYKAATEGDVVSLTINELTKIT